MVNKYDVSSLKVAHVCTPTILKILSTFKVYFILWIITRTKINCVNFKSNKVKYYINLGKPQVVRPLRPLELSGHIFSHFFASLSLDIKKAFAWILSNIKSFYTKKIHLDFDNLFCRFFLRKNCWQEPAHLSV